MIMRKNLDKNDPNKVTCMSTTAKTPIMIVKLSTWSHLQIEKGMMLITKAIMKTNCGMTCGITRHDLRARMELDPQPSNPSDDETHGHFQGQTHHR
jgi:hypothetical protein